MLYSNCGGFSNSPSPFINDPLFRLWHVKFREAGCLPIGLLRKEGQGSSLSLEAKGAHPTVGSTVSQAPWESEPSAQ